MKVEIIISTGLAVSGLVGTTASLAWWLSGRFRAIEKLIFENHLVVTNRLTRLEARDEAEVD